MAITTINPSEIVVRITNFVIDENMSLPEVVFYSLGLETLPIQLVVRGPRIVWLPDRGECPALKLHPRPRQPC